MNTPRRDHGFTLIEMMIVVVVIAILAAIAVPSYQESVRKSRRADGRVALNDVAQRLERCYTQFGTYDAAECVLAASIPSKEGFYAVTVVRDASTYTLTATPDAGGPQVHDKCGWLSIDGLGVKASELDDDQCW